MRNKIDDYKAYLIDGAGNRLAHWNFHSRMLKEAIGMMEALASHEIFWKYNPGCKTIEFYRNEKLIYTQNVSR